MNLCFRNGNTNNIKEEMKKIMKIFQSLEVCCLLINNFTKIIEMRTLGLLGIMLTGKDVIRTVDGVISAELDFYRLTI